MSLQHLKTRKQVYYFDKKNKACKFEFNDLEHLTIKLLRENKVDCKIMVGGAVLTPEYAEKIGADYYSKDAKESVDIAKKVLG